jgi:DNA-3-methyladenine glycosylase I
MSSSIDVDAGPDRIWGQSLHDDRGLFEMLVLEGFQSGLSWLTICASVRPSAAPSPSGTSSGSLPMRSPTSSGCSQTPGSSDTGTRSRPAIANAAATQALHERGETPDALLWSFAPADEGHH